MKECENCKGVPRIFNCCWNDLLAGHKNDYSCDEYKFRSLCSSDCIKNSVARIKPPAMSRGFKWRATRFSNKIKSIAGEI